MKSLKIISICPCMIVLQDIIQVQVSSSKDNCEVHIRYIIELQKVMQRLQENGLGIFTGALKYFFREDSIDPIKPE